jgi:hypothetical protein
MTPGTDFQSEQIRELQAELTFMRRRLFGDSREANGESLYRTVSRTHDDAQLLKLEFTKMRTWNIFLTAGFGLVVVILVIILYMFLTGGTV